MPGITNPAEPFFKDGVWGWDGSDWQKAGIFLNYSDRYAVNLGQVGVAGGLYSATSGAVPAGKVYVINSVSMNNQTGARGAAVVHFRVAGLYATVAFTLAPLQYEPTVWNGAVALKQGDFIQVQQLATVAGDTIIACGLGYIVELT